MIKMKLRYILLYCAIFVIAVIQGIQRQVRTDCKPTVDLICNKNGNKRFTYYMYHERADVKPGCSKDSKISKAEWAMISTETSQTVHSQSKSPKDNSSSLTIPERAVPAGKYTLQFVATETGGGSTTASCPFEFISEPPIIIFKHMQLQYVLTGMPYTVDIRESRFKGGGFPEVKWSVQCVYKRGEPRQIKCENAAPMKGMMFTGIMHKCFDDLTFTATVMYDGAKYTATHVVTPRKLFSCKVDVTCEKNCDQGGSMLSNPTIPIVLKIKPSNLNCLAFNTWRPKWIVQEEKKVSDDKLEIVNDNKRLIIKANTLKYDASVSVLATEKDQFEAWFRLRTIPKIKQPICTVEPKSGISMETLFTVSCPPKDKYLETHGPYFLAHQRIDGEDKLLTATADPTFQVYISAIKGHPKILLKIRGHDMFHNPFVCLVYLVTVSEKKQTSESIKKDLERIEQMTKDADPLGPQLAASLLQEVKQQGVDKQTVNEVKAKLMKILIDMPMETMSAYEQAAELSKLFVDDGDPSLKYKEELVPLCKKLGMGFLKEQKKEVYAQYQEENAKAKIRLVELTVFPIFLNSATTELPRTKLENGRPNLADLNTSTSSTHNTPNSNLKCADKLLQKTKEEDEDIEVEVTTQPDVEKVVKEDYPDYDNLFKNPTVEKVKQTGIDIIIDSAKAVATTLNGGESFKQSSAKSDTIIAVEEGNFMANKTLKSGSITVIPTEKFKDEGENLVTAIVSQYARDVITPKTELSSDIVDVHFFKNSSKMEDTSYNIQFPLINDSIPYDKFNVTTPKAGDTFLQIDRIMNVHRLNLYALETPFVRFKIAQNVKLGVAVSVNERPRGRHFLDDESYSVVDGANPASWAIQYPYARNEGDAFYYVAVIPHVDMLQEEAPETVDYEVQFSQIACVIYSRSKHNWLKTEGCDVRVVGGDKEAVIHCICSSASLHSAIYQPIQNRLEEQLEIEYTLVDFVNYVIFIHVLIVFIAYAIALALTLKRRPKIFGKNKIYFLSDNLKNDRFCYMLVIRTGSLNASGTTANIMTQIFGTKGTSKPHVLNYPDPGCKLMQRDCADWMILAHSKHLGDLESILLWTDGIGLFPEWYCVDITIFDLQTKKSYLFVVDNWMSPLSKHYYYLRVKVTTDTGRKQKAKLEVVKHLRFHHSGRHTWNIFVLDDEDITYPERLTVVLSMILTTYMVTIWMLGPPTLTRADAFGYGEFQFYSEIAYYILASSLLSSLIHLTMVYFFRNSKRSEVTTALLITSKRYSFKSRKILRCVLVGWVIFSMMYLITFGFWVTEHSMYLWIFITYLSILMSIIIWENLFIILLDITLARKGYVEKHVYRFDAILIEIERQRKILFKRFGEVLLRPYFRLHYRLLTPNELFKLRHIIATRLEVASLFKDMCLFILFIGILYLICLVQYDTIYNRSNRMMRRIVEDSIYANRTNLLEDIEKIEDVYDYLEFVIIPSMHPTNWYGRWYASEAGLLADFATKMLGVVQLRQQRRLQKCRVPHALKVLRIPCTNYAPVFDDWEFNDGWDITSTIGHYKIYDGSGYVAYLGRSLRNSKYILEVLRKYKWIDINTAVLFIDFLTYNANLNMFNAVRIVIERSPTGRYRKSVHIFTTSLVFTNLFLEIFIAFLLILLIVVIVIMLVKRLVQILTFKGKYFNSFWNLLDIALSILSIALVTLFFLRKRYTANLLESIVEADHNKFVNYYHLITISDAAVITYGITLALATLRLWKFLHFGLLFRIMERAILKSGPQLFGLFIYQICVYLMMVSFIYPLYGENMEAFKDYYTALVTMYLASINFTEHLANIYTSMHTSLLYLVYSFYLVVSLCFLNMYATTLMINLEESRIYYSNATHLYTIHNYVQDVFCFYKEKLRRHLESTRLKGGGDGVEVLEIDVDKLVYPKAQEHRYADVITMNKRKMRLMKNIAIVAVKNMAGYGKRKHLTEQDYDRMAEIVLNLIKTENDEKERFAHVFFKGWDHESGRMRFVPDAKLLQIEMVVKKMVEGKMEEIDIEKNTMDMVIHQSGVALRMKKINKCLELINSNIKHIVLVQDRSKVLEMQRLVKLEKRKTVVTQVDVHGEPIRVDNEGHTVEVTSEHHEKDNIATPSREIKKRRVSNLYDFIYS